MVPFEHSVDYIQLDCLLNICQLTKMSAYSKRLLILYEHTRTTLLVVNEMR